MNLTFRKINGYTNTIEIKIRFNITLDNKFLENIFCFTKDRIYTTSIMYLITPKNMSCKFIRSDNIEVQSCKKYNIKMLYNT